MSKGSKPRPCVKKQYDDNYDAIDWGKKITKESIEKFWLDKLKRDYPHMSKMQRLKYLFDFGILKIKGD